MLLFIRLEDETIWEYFLSMEEKNCNADFNFLVESDVFDIIYGNDISEGSY